ncbi:MAG: hypothetical protein RBR45_14235 [Pseudomonas sp.]|nr:hypothetical protein [Pseudomonas sp.]
MKYTPMHKLDGIDLNGYRGHVWCSYNKESLEIINFYITGFCIYKSKKKTDLIKITQQEIIDLFIDIYDTPELEDELRDVEFDINYNEPLTLKNTGCKRKF